MSYFGKLMEFLKFKIETPKPYGTFHLITLGIIVIFILLICVSNKKHNEKKLRISLALFGFTSLILEITKQLMWSCNYDASSGITTWDYQWFAFPFQFCSTPMYAACIASLLKECKVRRALLSYLGYFTILGSFMVMLLPTDIYTDQLMIDIHTTVLHAGGLVISLFLLIHGYVKPKRNYLLSGFLVYVVCVIIAQTLNFTIYKVGILNGETYDMFFISPYFKTSMPVFTTIEQYVSDEIYVVLYIIAFVLGSSLVYFITKLANKEKKKDKFHNLEMEYIERFSLYFPYKDRTLDDSIKLMKKSLEDNKPYQ